MGKSMLLVTLLTACSPAAGLRPLLPYDAANPFELTVGATETFNGNRASLGDFPLGPGPNVQMWFDGRVGRRVVLGGGMFAGLTTGIGGGLGVRVVFWDKAGFVVGLDVEGGLWWGEAGIPVTWQALPWLCIYTQPSFGLRIPGDLRIPLGARFAPNEHVGIIVEGAVQAGMPNYFFERFELGEAASVGFQARF